MTTASLLRVACVFVVSGLFASRVLAQEEEGTYVGSSGGVVGVFFNEGNGSYTGMVPMDDGGMVFVPLSNSSEISSFLSNQLTGTVSKVSNTTVTPATVGGTTVTGLIPSGGTTQVRYAYVAVGDKAWFTGWIGGQQFGNLGDNRAVENFEAWVLTVNDYVQAGGEISQHDWNLVVEALNIGAQLLGMVDWLSSIIDMIEDYLATHDVE